MSKIRLLSVLSIFIVNGFFAAVTFAGDGGAYRTVHVENAFVDLQFARSSGKLEALSLINKVSGTRYPMQGGFFDLRTSYPGNGITPDPVTPTRMNLPSLILNSWEKQDLSSEVRYVFFLEGAGIEVKLVFSLPVDRPLIRYHVEILNSGADRIFLEKLVLLTSRFSGAMLDLGGFGQPVYGEDIFFGIEYPCAYNEITDPGSLSCWYRIGQPVAPTEKYISETAVIGLSETGDTQHRFFEYITTLRPRVDRPFLLYNTWYDIRSFTPEKIRHTIDEFKKTLVKMYNLKLDAFVIDDGWDDTSALWQVDQSKFPGGFEEVADLLSEVSDGLGLWISPWGGYDRALKTRIKNGSGKGYETCGIHFCLGGDRYYKTFKEELIKYVSAGDLSFLKIDGFLSLCNESDHAHLPGIYSRPFLTHRFIDLLKAIRKIKPDIFIDITVGTWLSPWWLQYADAVWMTGADYGHAEDVPAISERDKAITFRDRTLYKDFVRDRIQFPLSNVMTHGIIKGRLNLLGGEQETLYNWQDNTIMYFSRGVMMWELYISPDVLSEAEWDFMARVIKWAGSHAAVFKNTRFIGGDPYGREVYGYVHETPEEVWVILRNPFIAPQPFEISLNILAGTYEHKQLRAEQIYPFHSFLKTVVTSESGMEIGLSGYETKVFRFYNNSNSQPPVITDVVLTDLSIDGEDVSFTAALDPMDLVCPEFLPGGTREDITLNDLKISEDELHRLMCKQQKFAREKLTASVELASLQPDRVGGIIRWPGGISEFRGSLAILLDLGSPVDSLTIGIADTQHKVLKGAGGQWYWILVPVDSGARNVNFTIRTLPGQIFPKGSLSIWALGRVALIPVGKIAYRSEHGWPIRKEIGIAQDTPDRKFSKQLFNCDLIH